MSIHMCVCSCGEAIKERTFQPSLCTNVDSPKGRIYIFTNLLKIFGKLYLKCLGHTLHF